jgi:hypothetical protein
VVSSSCERRQVLEAVLLILAFTAGAGAGAVAAYAVTTLGRGSRFVSGPLALLCLAALVLSGIPDDAPGNFAEGMLMGGCIVAGWRFVSPRSWEKR